MRNFSQTYLAYRNKLTNKLWGVAHMPAVGKKKGDVLFSYFTESFTYPSGKPFPNYHTMYWECFEIAKLFSERGYAVDIINTKDHRFIPKKPYKFCIDTENDLERLLPYLPKDCKKIFHILISNSEEYNAAEQKRLNELDGRRGIKLLPRRKMQLSKSPQIADYLEGFGNKTLFATFEKFGKPITWIPISAVLEYPFNQNKNWGDARKHFLWFGGGGLVLKGLDLVLEAFSKMPDVTLDVCGPIHGEEDFVKEYQKELYETPNIKVHGRLNIDSDEFKELLEKCGAVIYPSAGEGTSGAIVQLMHAGIIPIISPETGIQENAPQILIENPNVEKIMEIAKSFSNEEVGKLATLSKEVWQYARATYTREKFSKAYANFIDNILKI